MTTDTDRLLSLARESGAIVADVSEITSQRRMRASFYSADLAAFAERIRQDHAAGAVLVCYEAYQVVGSLLSDVGKFDTPEAEKVLDNLCHARPVHADVLPWPSYERELEQRIRQDERERAALLISSGKFCRYVEHAQEYCDCGEMAAAIRSSGTSKGTAHV